MRECGNQSKTGGNGDALEGGVGIFNSGGMGSSSLPSLAEIIRHFRATGSSSDTDIFDFILFFWCAAIPQQESKETTSTLVSG